MIPWAYSVHILAWACTVLHYRSQFINPDPTSTCSPVSSTTVQRGNEHSSTVVYIHMHKRIFLKTAVEYGRQLNEWVVGVGFKGDGDLYDAPDVTVGRVGVDVNVNLTRYARVYMCSRGSKR